MKTNYLLTIEFRYSAAPKFEDDCTSKSKFVTVGVFDDYDIAAAEGNKALEVFEKHFKLHVFPKGNVAQRERFSKHGGCFGGAKDLISDLAYLQTPFSFYAKIQTLKHFDVESTILEVLEDVKKYKAYKLKEKD